MFNYIKFSLFLRCEFDQGGDKKAGEKPTETIPETKTSVLLDVMGNIIKYGAEYLAGIKNEAFLKIDFDKRLQYITSPKVDFNDVASGKTKDVSFTFTYAGKFNRELYMHTTAGQVLPPEVNAVTIGGENYTRSGLKGEFFTSSGQRLIIKEGTKISIPGVRDEKQIEDKQKEYDKNVSTFISENPEISRYQDLIKEAAYRGIDIKFALLAFKDTYDKTPENEKKTTIEAMMTYFDKYKGYFNDLGDLKDGKYSQKLALGVLAKYNKDTWQQKAVEYGFKEKDIEEYKSNGEIYLSQKAEDIQNDDSLLDGGYLKGEALLQNSAFNKKLHEVCTRLGANFDDMVRLMKAESGLDPRIINGQSGATGLIQFMPKTAIDLGTTTGKIRKMTAVEQLDLVELYFRKNSHQSDLGNIENLYKVVFYPYALREGDDFVFGSQNGTQYSVAAQNGVIAKFSKRSDGLIDGYCFRRYALDHVSKFSV
ncbi:MAG: transglycosylase SLT domain-containing protein [Candidatus Gracilibacteria bacterium]|nr:transglycosylase SLT domain-containing protein [Candidatus Gracilibacteria bacterium]